MKKVKGFTLIELLVVITIIGILAVGGIQVYTTQIQKARDSTRIQDMMTLRSGFEQYYFDNGRFLRRTNLPGTENMILEYRKSMKVYVPNVENITDPKDKDGGASENWYSCIKRNTNNSKSKVGCIYLYRTTHNSYSTDGYELSTAFESLSNICRSGEDCKSENDGGNNNYRYEVGSYLDIITETTNEGRTRNIDSNISGEENWGGYIVVTSLP